MSDKILTLGPATSLEIPAQSVIRLLGQSQSTEVNLKLTVGSGSGVHLLVPATVRQASYEIEVAEQAQFTLAFLGQLTDETNCFIKLRLKGHQAKANLELAVLVTGASQAKFDVLIAHQAKQTMGRINSRRVQLGKSSSEFVGTLYVAEGAQGTDTYLSDKTLLLGELSQAKSDPRLEILADDVKASHGATIGRLSEEELFYLRSRELPEELARAILVQSFLKPALVGVPLEIKDKFLHDISIR